MCLKLAILQFSDMDLSVYLNVSRLCQSLVFSLTFVGLVGQSLGFLGVKTGFRTAFTSPYQVH